ncbi:hypothetical protein ACNR9Q_03545 [Maribacter sp. X9]|uniref:hypothetical protein n=1 Tax=Maribacter sp. X9 TaxID=3402159 RepID=UPI003AF38160
MLNTAIVILNYNNWEDTIECLETVLKQSLQDSFTVFVVDNSETNNSIDQIKKWSCGQLEVSNYLFPEIVEPFVEKPLSFQFFYEFELQNTILKDKLILVKATRNNGFAAGNNIILNEIRSNWKQFDFIWLLNNDTIVKKDTLCQILNRVAHQKNESEMFGTPLLEYFEPNKIQAFGGRYNKYFALTRHLGEGKNLNLLSSRNVAKYKIDYPIGASIIITRIFLENVGLLNEKYFLFFEELDWVLRFRKVGGIPKILDVFGVFHKQGASTKVKTQNLETKNEFIDLLALKNRILFTKTYYKKYLITVILFISTVTVLKRLILGDYKRVFRIYKLIYKQIF